MLVSILRAALPISSALDEVIVPPVAIGTHRLSGGHDMHVVALLAVVKLLADARSKWRGTLIVLFQPNEELAGGAQAMIDDELFDGERHNIATPDILFNPARSRHQSWNNSRSCRTRPDSCQLPQSMGLGPRRPWLQCL